MEILPEIKSCGSKAIMEDDFEKTPYFNVIAKIVI